MNLKDLRKKKKLTQAQASKILEITSQYLSLIETGDRNPSDRVKDRMCNLYNCSINDIFLAIKSTKRQKND